MKGIVWYNNFKIGLEKITDIKNKYIKYGIEINTERRTSYSTTIYFENGDIWMIVPAKENSKGYSCNVSYIERDIPKDIIECVIRPCTKAFPYQAYNYYS